MQTYTFKVVVEPDEGGYHAYCPALRRFGAVTQGSTEAEALKNINEVVQMIMDELREDSASVSYWQTVVWSYNGPPETTNSHSLASFATLRTPVSEYLILSIL